MVIVNVALAAPQVPLAGMLLVTTQVPGVLFARSICPVLTCTKVKQTGVAEKKPALAPGPKVGKGLLVFWQNGEPAYVKVAEGVTLVMVIVMELVFGHAPFVVQESVYTPTALAAKLMVPVEELIDKPIGVDEKTPPGKPVIVGIGFAPDWQQVAEEQTKEASSAGVMVNVVVAMAAPQVPLGGIVFVTV